MWLDGSTINQNTVDRSFNSRTMTQTKC